MLSVTNTYLSTCVIKCNPVHYPPPPSLSLISQSREAGVTTKTRCQRCSLRRRTGATTGSGRTGQDSRRPGSSRPPLLTTAGQGGGRSAMLSPEQPAAPPVHLADEELSAALVVAVVHRAVGGTTPTPELMSSTWGWLNPRQSRLVDTAQEPVCRRTAVATTGR